MEEDTAAKQVDDSSDEPSGLDEYEVDGFLVSDAEEERDKEKKKKTVPKKRKRRVAKKPFILDDDDLSLIVENNGGPPVKTTQKPFKRLKKRRKRDLEQEAELAAKTLFGSDDDDDVSKPNKSIVKEDSEPSDFDSNGEEDMGQWMVSSDEEESALGSTSRRSKKRSFQRGAMHTARQDQLDEANDIFGGDMADFMKRTSDPYGDEGSDEELGLSKSGRDSALKARKKTSIIEQYEPSLLAEKYFTDEDDKIRRTDKPERLQLRFPNLTNDATLEGSVHSEAEWIYERVFKSKENNRAVISKISYVLDFIKKDLFEIPFISQYRKEYYLPELTAEDLWIVYDWDEKYVHLLTRKSSLKKMYNRIVDLDSDYLNGLLKTAQTELEVKDLFDHFQMHYSNDILSSSQSQQSNRPKRPVKRDFYSVCKKNGIVSFANEIVGMSAKQFGENLMDSFMINKPKQHDQDPYFYAQEFLNKNFSREFPDEESILKACRFILSQEIAYDPQVRHSLREFYQTARLSTFPTARGKKEIDNFHRFKSVKRLDRKPISKFDGWQYLLISKAEKEGLLDVRIELSKEDSDNSLNEMARLYLDTSTHAIAQQWNEQRNLILKSALLDHLTPLFQSEIRSKLFADASEQVALFSVKILKNRLNISPFKSSKSSDHDFDDDFSRVAGAVWGDDNLPSYLVFLDEHGEVLDRLRLDYVTARLLPSDTRKSEEESKIRNFVSSHKPQVIVLGATPGELDSKKLFDYLHFALDRTNWRGKIVYADTQVARIFKDSDRAKKEFPTDPPLLRQAISLARELQDPLTEISGLCSDSDEILCLHLHPFQDMISKDFLLKHFIRCFIDLVNKVGVDINRVLLHKWTSSTLQFISGLGPRKSMNLIQSLYRRGGMVSSREEIDEILKPESSNYSNSFSSHDNSSSSCVYVNCSAFLRIRSKYFKDSDDDDDDDHYHHSTKHTDVLDDTRVHPKDYEFARKMAADALESDEPESQWQYLVKDLMDDPHKLEEIDLDSFAEEWERSGKGKKALTLYDIKKELSNPFGDLRKEWKEPTPEDIFNMLTGESKDTMQRGQLVNARIQKVTSKTVFCELENGLTGIIDKNEISEDIQFKDIHDIVSPGQSRVCKIIRVDRDKFEIELTSLEREVRDDKSSFDGKSSRDPYLLPDDHNDNDVDTDGGDSKYPSSSSDSRSSSSSSTSSSSRKKHFPVKKTPVVRQNTRIINHPRFQNLTFRDAEKSLKDKDVGEQAIIIRASSKGPKHLTITWKFCDDVYIHTDVLETEKMVGSKAVGRIYTVKDSDYEDLDEIIYRFIIPITEHAKQVIKFRYFRPGDKRSIDKRMKADKDKDAARIPYFIGVAKDYPGRFILFYMPGRQAKHEYITVVPEGLRFRNQTFKDPDRLIKWFKVHFKEAPPSSSSSRGRDSSGTTGSSSSTSRSSTTSSSSTNNNSNSSSMWNLEPTSSNAWIIPDTSAWE